MSTNTERTIRKLAVVGAGNMGSGIAQKMATEGFAVELVDLDEEKAARGIGIVKETLAQGVERKIFRAEQVESILGRLHGTADWNDLADCDLVVEAVFEDEKIKREVFGRLDEVCRNDAILATNTSSLSVTRLAAATRHPSRVLGLHYFFHPAKNRLVEVVPGQQTEPAVTRSAWALQEQIGKTPIACADVFGFVVNRFFVPWLNEAVRLLEEGLSDIATIEATCKKTFGVGMGPFELMNVTGVPIALHAATTLGEELGPLYAPADKLRAQVELGQPWKLDGEAAGQSDAVDQRMLAVVFYVASALVGEGVGTIEDTDIGARVGLRWPRGPFQMINRTGVERAVELVRPLAERWELQLPQLLAAQAGTGKPFRFELVKSDVHDGTATLTINRPDAMNALNEQVVGQLHDTLKAAIADDAVRGIVITGAGKAFIAGADIRFFVRNIDAGDIDRIVAFTRAGHALLAEIAGSPKRVVARLNGLALGGGLELALACDGIVTTPSAQLAFPETGIGIYPGLGGTQRGARRIGPDLAKWLIFTGEMLTGEQARDIGLVDKVVPHAELDRAASQAAMGETTLASAATWPVAYAELASFFSRNSIDDVRLGKADTGEKPALVKAMKRVSTKAPLAMRLAEKLIDAGKDVSLDEGLQMELDHLVEIFRSEDAYEGLSSLGKRKPVFKGK